MELIQEQKSKFQRQKLILAEWSISHVDMLMFLVETRSWSQIFLCERKTRSTFRKEKHSKRNFFKLKKNYKIQNKSKFSFQKFLYNEKPKSFHLALFTMHKIDQLFYFI